MASDCGEDSPDAPPVRPASEEGECQSHTSQTSFTVQEIEARAQATAALLPSTFAFGFIPASSSVPRSAPATHSATSSKARNTSQSGTYRYSKRKEDTSIAEPSSKFDEKMLAAANSSTAVNAFAGSSAGASGSGHGYVREMYTTSANAVRGRHASSSYIPRQQINAVAVDNRDRAGHARTESLPHAVGWGGDAASSLSSSHSSKQATQTHPRVLVKRNRSQSISTSSVLTGKARPGPQPVPDRNSSMRASTTSTSSTGHTASTSATQQSSPPTSRCVSSEEHHNANIVSASPAELDDRSSGCPPARPRSYFAELPRLSIHTTALPHITPLTPHRRLNRLCPPTHLNPQEAASPTTTPPFLLLFPLFRPPPLALARPACIYANPRWHNRGACGVLLLVPMC